MLHTSTSAPGDPDDRIDLPDARVTSRSGWVLRAAVPVLLMVVLSIAGWVRLSPQVRNTVWAEDGKVFLEEQYNLGFWGALFHDYAGYLHVVPRTVIGIASHLQPVDRFAVTVSGLCVLIVAAVGVAVYVLTAGVIRSVPARILLAAVPTLLPLGPMEIQANVANLHWFLMFLTPFLLLTPVRSWTKGIVLGVVALLCGLTEIQVIAFFPLFLLGLRNRRRWPLLLGATLGGAAQVVTTLLHPRAAQPGGHVSLSDILLGYVVEPVGGSWTWSMPTIGRLISEHGVVVVLLPFVVVLALVAVGFWIGYAGQRWVLASMIWGSAIVWCASVYLNPNPMFAFAHFSSDQWPTIWTFRYSAAGSMYVIAGFVAVLDAFLVRRSPVLRIVGVLLVAVVLWVFVANFAMDKSNRQQGPFWESQVDQSVSSCEDQPAENAVIQIAPGAQWAVTVPCALIDRDAAR